MFWFLNKETNTAAIFGSISAISTKVDINKNELYYQFSRLKKSEFENEEYRIVKCDVIREIR